MAEDIQFYFWKTVTQVNLGYIKVSKINVRKVILQNKAFTYVWSMEYGDNTNVAYLHSQVIVLWFRDSHDSELRKM